jgi:hypothetical protein
VVVVALAVELQRTDEVAVVVVAVRPRSSVGSPGLVHVDIPQAAVSVASDVPQAAVSVASAEVVSSVELVVLPAVFVVLAVAAAVEAAVEVAVVVVVVVLVVELVVLAAVVVVLAVAAAVEAAVEVAVVVVGVVLVMSGVGAVAAIAVIAVHTAKTNLTTIRMRPLPRLARRCSFCLSIRLGCGVETYKSRHEAHSPTHLEGLRQPSSFLHCKLVQKFMKPTAPMNRQTHFIGWGSGDGVGKRGGGGAAGESSLRKHTSGNTFGKSAWPSGPALQHNTARHGSTHE